MSIETLEAHPDEGYSRSSEDLAARDMRRAEERRSMEADDEENMHPDDVDQSRHFGDHAQDDYRHKASLYDDNQYHDEDPGEIARNNT